MCVAGSSVSWWWLFVCEVLGEGRFGEWGGGCWGVQTVSPPPPVDEQSRSVVPVEAWVISEPCAEMGALCGSPGWRMGGRSWGLGGQLRTFWNTGKGSVARALMHLWDRQVLTDAYLFQLVLTWDYLLVICWKSPVCLSWIFIHERRIPFAHVMSDLLHLPVNSCWRYFLYHCYLGVGISLPT